MKQDTYNSISIGRCAPLHKYSTSGDLPLRVAVTDYDRKVHTTGRFAYAHQMSFVVISFDFADFEAERIHNPNPILYVLKPTRKSTNICCSAVTLCANGIIL